MNLDPVYCSGCRRRFGTFLAYLIHPCQPGEHRCIRARRA